MKHRILYFAFFLLIKSIGFSQSTYNLQKLIPTDSDEYDFFGNSINISNDLLIIGARNDFINGIASGSAYIYKYVNNIWVEQSKILPNDGDDFNYFGYSVSISGDYAIISSKVNNSYSSDTSAVYFFQYLNNVWTQIQKFNVNNGYFDFASNSVSISGDYAVFGANNINTVYVFYNNSGNWEIDTIITPFDGQNEDNYGQALCISNNLLIVGSSQDDDIASGSGSAYIYMHDNYEWQFETKITASDGANNNWFGRAVSICGDYAIIGADKYLTSGAQAGSAYIFHKNDSMWEEQAILTPSNSFLGDQFGHSVGITNNYAIVGAPSDNNISNHKRGSSYVFFNNNSNWEEIHILLASDADDDDFFGKSLAISGDNIVVGAPGDDDYGDNSGSAYSYNLYLQNISELDSEHDKYIYPNPTTGIINIKAEGIERIKVMNIEGKQIYNGKENKIDLSIQPKGIYIIKIIADKQTITKKLIKQ